MDQPETPLSVLKTESTRETITLIFGVISIVVFTYVRRKLDEPDAVRTFTMTWSLRVKHFAERQEDFWRDIAERAATIYNRERA